MAPVILIIIVAIIGFAIWGFKGLFIGAALGWFTSMAIGTVANLISGGLLPRGARRDTALSFIRNYSNIVDSCTIDLSESKKLKFVESQIERIFRKATTNAPIASPTMGVSKPEILIATEQIALEETNENLRRLLLVLARHIEETMY